MDIYDGKYECEECYEEFTVFELFHAVEGDYNSMLVCKSCL